MGSSQRSKRGLKRTKQSKSHVKLHKAKIALSNVSSNVDEAQRHPENIPSCSRNDLSNEPLEDTKLIVQPFTTDAPTEIVLDNAWGTEYESIMSYQHTVEVVDKPNCSVTGNRIVNLEFVLNWALTLQLDHAKICTCGQLYLSKEIRNGFSSKLIFQCTMCTRTLTKYTQKPSDVKKLPYGKYEEYPVNIGAVWGSLSTGSCHSHLEELCSLMDIPPMDYRKFHKIEENLADCWHDNMLEEFAEAGKEEAKIASEHGNVDDDEIPYITVYLDGGWSKRSYGHNYDAASGSAVIIGKATKKVLFMGVRNKFCYVCAVAHNKKKTAGDHRCYRNWNGTSTSMEADIIVEGFNKSIDMHGLRYKYFIADGDSSTFANLRTKVPYGPSIMKTECKNHVIKNYSKHLYNLKNDKLIQTNKFLTITSIKKLVDIAKYQIHHNKSHGTLESLRDDLANGPYHVFGDHTKCVDYYRQKDDGLNLVEEMKSCAVFQRVEACTENLRRKPNFLFENETNNRAELFMSLLAKFNAGKRINFTMKGSFEGRCKLASLQYNSGHKWHLNSWRKSMKMSPNKNLKRLTKKKNNCKRLRPKCRKSLFSKTKTAIKDNDYGLYAAEAELNNVDMEQEVQRILDKMQVSAETRDRISKETVGQFGNARYEEERRNRLTASQFGAIVKRRLWTPCHSAVKSIVYGCNFYSQATEYGKINEKAVIDKFNNQYKLDVKPSGFFIDLVYGFLGASPDGLIDDDGVVEVKCLHSIHKSGLTLRRAAEEGNICLELVNDNLQLKRKHNYYFQVQGQMNIASKEYCYFVVYVDDKNDLFVEKIYRDRNLWNNEMIPKLTSFYKENVAPELVRRNIPKGLRCIDSDRIKKAIIARSNILKK